MPFRFGRPARPYEEVESRPALQGWPWIRLIPVALVIIICVVAYHEWKGPEIHMASGQFDNPLATTFWVKNPTSMMPMDHMAFDCRLLSMTAIGAGGRRIQFENDDLQINDGPFALPPGHPSRINCNVARAMSEKGGYQTTTVRMEIIAEYTEFGLRRLARSDWFSWDSRTKAWSEGPAVN